MGRFKPLLFVGVLLFFGSVALSRFSSAQVRAVDALGLFASGMGCGAALCGLVIALTVGRKSRREGTAADRPRD